MQSNRYLVLRYVTVAIARGYYIPCMLAMPACARYADSYVLDYIHTSGIVSVRELREPLDKALVDHCSVRHESRRLVQLAAVCRLLAGVLVTQVFHESLVCGQFIDHIRSRCAERCDLL